MKLCMLKLTHAHGDLKRVDILESCQKEAKIRCMRMVMKFRGM